MVFAESLQDFLPKKHFEFKFENKIRQLFSIEMVQIMSPLRGFSTQNGEGCKNVIPSGLYH